MPRILVRCAVVCLVLACAAPAHAADVLLQNDGFFSGANAAYQGGFDVGEIAAVDLTPADPGPHPLKEVRLLFGDTAIQRFVILHIWDGPSGTNPGVEIYTETYQLTGSSGSMSLIDLSAENITIDGTFRVGIEMVEAGLPSVARDDDGSINTTKNFIFANGIGWAQSSLFGLTGDWVIRAVISVGAQADPQQPAITAISDIGNDQGRSVRIDFDASSEDALGSPTQVLEYEAYRRIDPLPGAAARLAGWEYVGSVPAHGESSYSMVVPTLADSTVVDGMHWSTFFVRGATADPLVFFDAPPDSGYSLDNLAPAPPMNLVLQGDLLAWDPSAEADFAWYNVYESASPTFDGGASLLGQTATNAFDTTGATGPYLFVTAADFSGNEGEAAGLNTLTASNAAPTPRAPLSVRPNPFNPATQIHFTLPADGPVTLRVYDLRGRVVDSLLEQAPRRAGPQTVDYRSALPTGVYLLRAWSASWQETTKLSIVK